MCPYIKKEKRDMLDSFQELPFTAGELNYCLTKIILQFLGEEPKYQNYNDVLGVLTAIQFELYRRRIADYEDKKLIKNGDAF